MPDRHSQKAADLAQMRSQLVALGEAIRVLADKDDLTPKEAERFDLSLKEYENLKAEITLATNAARSALRNDPSVTSSRGHDGPAPAQWRQSDRRAAWEYAGREPSQRVGYAMRGIETACEMAESMTGLRSDIAPSIRSTLERHPRAADAIVARSDPAYVTAFSKLVTIGDPGRAFASMTEEERNAFARTEQEHRAANEGTGSAGGYGVPVLIDPAIILLGTGSINPFRELAKTESGVSDVFKGVATAGITANWTAEGGVVADGTPTLIQPSITAYKGACFVPFSIELEADYATVTEQLVTLFVDAQAVLETTAFSTGSGSGQPYGIQTRLVNNTFSQITSTTHGTIGTVDVYNLFAALPPRYRPGSEWLGSAVTQNAIRSAGNDLLGQLGSAGYAAGSSLMPISADGVQMMLLGKRYYESSGFVDLPTNSTATAAYLTVTDLSKSYIIFDRLNSGAVELVPHLFDPTTGRPLGERGAWYSWRVGGDMTNSTGTGETGARTLMNKTS
jgi:HK97 family phage major capsid protein